MALPALEVLLAANALSQCYMCGARCAAADCSVRFELAQRGRRKARELCALRRSVRAGDQRERSAAQPSEQLRADATLALSRGPPRGAQPS